MNQYLDSGKSFKYWAREFHYGPWDPVQADMDKLQDDLIDDARKRGYNVSKESPRIYGDDDGVFIKVDDLFKRQKILEAKKEAERKRQAKWMREKTKEKFWINPITGDLNDPYTPTFYKSSDEAIYSANRKRKFAETNDEIKIARKIYKMKCKIVEYKKQYKLMEENIPEFSPIHPFRQEEYLIEMLYLKLEIQNMEKQIQFYLDPLTGYHIDIEIPNPKTDPKRKRNFVEKCVDKVQEFSKKYIDPILNGFREFFERNQECLASIATVAGTVFGAAFKIMMIV